MIAEASTLLDVMGHFLASVLSAWLGMFSGGGFPAWKLQLQLPRNILTVARSIVG